MNGGRTVPGVVIVSDILIDVIEEPDGSRVTRAGGAGFNLAASVARLGVPATLIAPVAEDSGGRFLSDAARAARVSLVNLENPWPTTVAISRRVNGEPQYTFSEWMRERRFPLASVDASALEGNVLAVNSFPMNDPVQVEDLTRFAKSAGLMLVTDPNARPTLLGDLAAYRGGVETLAAASVAIKLSTEDIENLDLGAENAAVRRLLDLGVPAVVVTRGASDCTAYLSDGAHVSVPVPERPDPVIDTLGAGDAVLARVACEVSRLGPVLTTEQWTSVLAEAMEPAADVCRVKGGVLEARTTQFPDTQGPSRS